MRAELVKELVTHLTPFVTERRVSMFRRVAARRTRRLTVVLEEIEDPNDVCAVMRSCDCFGVQDLHIVSGASPFKLSPGVAVGSSKWISLYRHGVGSAGGERSCLDSLNAGGYRIAAFSSERDAMSIEDVPLEPGLALVFSGRREGLWRAADASVRIPTRGFGQKFNLSVSAALCLAVLRRRLQTAPSDWRLSADEREALTLAWLGKMGKRMPILIGDWLSARGLEWSSLPEIARSEIKAPSG